MEKLLLLSSVALATVIGIGPSQAQNAGNAVNTQPAANTDYCGQLVRFVHQNPDDDIAVRPDRLRRWQQANDQASCRRVWNRVHDQANNADAANATDTADNGSVVVRQPAPTVTLDQPEPQVTVRLAQPDVAVTQPQPEITVHQPAPQITVQIPQPEITVRMPAPGVKVSQAQPQVSVRQPKPTVQVVQPDQQAAVVQQNDAGKPQVKVIQPQEQASVDVNRVGQPDVRYQSEQPNIRVLKAEGQPRVRYLPQDQASAADANANAPGQNRNDGRQVAAANGGNAGARATNDVPAAGNADGATGSVQQGDTRQVPVSRLTGMTVVNARGNELGDVDRVVQDAAGNRTMAVIAHGGFLGLGEKKVTVPLQNMALAGDRLVVQGLTDDDIRAMPEWRDNDPNYRTLGEQRRTTVDVQP